MSHEAHQAAARSEDIGCAVVTVSDTRTADDDHSGALMQERLEAAGHAVVHYDLVPDEPDAIGALLDAHGQDDRVDAVLLSGGTGLSARDGTYEVVQQRLEKELTGFGELFRMLSYEEIGAAAMLSRAVAGTYRGRALFSMPGSTGAVRLAMDALILPELQHVVWELRR